MNNHGNLKRRQQDEKFIREGIKHAMVFLWWLMIMGFFIFEGFLK